MQLGKFRSDTVNDISVIHIGNPTQLEEDPPEGAQWTMPLEFVNLTNPTSHFNSFSLQNIVNFQNLALLNEAVIVGYPRSIGLRPSTQYEFESPLISKGIIAGINQNVQKIIVDSPVYGGNSGGPVFELTSRIVTYEIYFEINWCCNREDYIWIRYTNISNQ